VILIGIRFRFHMLSSLNAIPMHGNRCIMDVITSRGTVG
jgi:hypothetical protein